MRPNFKCSLKENHFQHLVIFYTHKVERGASQTVIKFYNGDSSFEVLFTGNSVGADERSSNEASNHQIPGSAWNVLLPHDIIKN